MITKSRLIEIITKLVSFPTVYTEKNEYLVREYINELFTQLNANIYELNKDDNRPNIFGEIGVGEKSLFLPVHMDVVPPGEGWDADPFKAIIKDENIIGRGVIDDKGPLAVIYLAVEKFIKEFPNFNGKIILAAVSDEEDDNIHGIKHILSTGFKADAALVIDGGYLNEVVFGEKGCLQFKIFSEGLQEHSALLKTNNNAIRNLVDLLYKLQHIEWGDNFDKDFTPVQINLSVINGGTYANFVAGSAMVQMDIRYPIGYSSSEVKAKIEETINSSTGKFRTEVVYFTEPHKLIDPKLLESFIMAAKNINFPMKAITLAGNSFAKELNQAGIPAILHLPVMEYSAHEANEYANINELLNSINIYYEFLKIYFEQK